MSTEGPAPGAPENEVFPTLTAAQIERIASCKREFSNLPVCEPALIRAACREGRCTNLYEPK